MKNYWLEQRNNLDSLINRRFRDDKSANDLTKKFMSLSETVIDNFNYLGWSKDDVIQECTMACYDKLDRYEKAQTKTKAEYYFAIIISSHLNQIFRSRKNKDYKKLKAKYQEYLQRKNNE